VDEFPRFPSGQVKKLAKEAGSKQNDLQINIEKTQSLLFKWGQKLNKQNARKNPDENKIKKYQGHIKSLTSLFTQQTNTLQELENQIKLNKNQLTEIDTLLEQQPFPKNHASPSNSSGD